MPGRRMGADRFYNLVRSGFYKDAAFFRIIPSFVAQFGIPARPDVAAAWEQRQSDRRSRDAIQQTRHGNLRDCRS